VSIKEKVVTKIIKNGCSNIISHIILDCVDQVL